MLSDSAPVLLVPAKTAVLLLFVPPNRQQRDELIGRVSRLRDVFGMGLRIQLISEGTYPDVTKSFDVTHLPTVVLVRQGRELWRYEGLPDETTLHLGLQCLNLPE